ncbi:PACE efflux transporter (plasmid) [Pantoea agglomerans]|uniref:PACE efflux transporter n=1 Tax=Enterobacter agglomerans TaxID=549 RepID=UPI00273A6BCF|nr:PACE efflux transporter [Pantoea agglomerans]WLO87080.1 PACE efflux transporter [Pantoea agglomerans]
MEKCLYPVRTRTERVLHAVVFEVVANVLVFFILIIITSAAPSQSLLLTLVSSTLAMGWNYPFNLMFDSVQLRIGFKKNLRMRCLHAVLFEAGLLLVLIPFAAWWLDITLFSALRLESGLVLFFLTYAFLFNLLWDWGRSAKSMKILN